jgi:deoxyribodipyrimidine photolyase-related protein
MRRLRPAVQLAPALGRLLGTGTLLFGGVSPPSGSRVVTVRHLVVVLGDQLDRRSAALDGFDSRRDRLWMAEVPAEATHVWSHKARIGLFLSAMRHHAEWLRAQGWPLDYLALGEHDHPGLGEALAAALASHRPQAVVVVWPGEHRVLELLRACCDGAAVPLLVRPDNHFLIDPGDFDRWAAGRKTLVMEHFYRFMRQRSGYLIVDGKPQGGQWNFDRDNRKSFGRQGPGMLSLPKAFPPDRLTRGVLELVAERFPDHPGVLDHFDWPVSRDQALAALDDFITQRLAAFGAYQDALWQGEPWLYHSRLSAALNLKLLDPREVIEAAIAALEAGQAPLASVEGFVRQILGWREYVRGIYWREMPDYLAANSLQAEHGLPPWYWTGETDMACLADALGQTLKLGYAHHIQRLMITGLFALLYGVQPRQLHEWYLAVYVDAVEWVEVPNTLGMSQFADGGLLGSKPYAASGRYIQRMGNYCDGCRYDPAQRLGEEACPYTTLYWDFLIRHETRFANHPRAGMQWRNLRHLDETERRGIQQQAAALRARLAGPVERV